MIRQAIDHPEAGMVIEYTYQGNRGTLTVTKVEKLLSGSIRVHYNEDEEGEGPMEGGVLYMEGGWMLLLTRVITITNVYFSGADATWEV